MPVSWEVMAYLELLGLPQACFHAHACQYDRHPPLIRPGTSFPSPLLGESIGRSLLAASRLRSCEVLGYVGHGRGRNATAGMCIARTTLISFCAWLL